MEETCQYYFLSLHFKKGKVIEKNRFLTDSSVWRYIQDSERWKKKETSQNEDHIHVPSTVSPYKGK